MDQGRVVHKNRLLRFDNTIINPPFPWATNRRATILRSKKLNKITGEVECKKCTAHCTYEFDLEEKFSVVAEYINQNKESMDGKAPKLWLRPECPTCNHCGQLNGVKPMIPDNQDEINWLFLLLGQFLGHCTVGQLKYFCQLSWNKRTGAKDSLLYKSYLGLCKQLDPTGAFDS